MRPNFAIPLLSVAIEVLTYSVVMAGVARDSSLAQTDNRRKREDQITRHSYFVAFYPVKGDLFFILSFIGDCAILEGLKIGRGRDSRTLR